MIDSACLTPSCKPTNLRIAPHWMHLRAVVLPLVGITLWVPLGNILWNKHLTVWRLCDLSLYSIVPYHLGWIWDSKRHSIARVLIGASNRWSELCARNPYHACIPFPKFEDKSLLYPSSKSTVPAKRFRPISLTSRRLKLAENAVLRCPTFSASIFDDLLHLACKPNRFTLDVVASLAYYVAMSLNVSAQPAQCVSLNFSSTLVSVPQSSTTWDGYRTFAPTGLSGWGGGRRTKSTPLVNNSGVLHCLFSTH